MTAKDRMHSYLQPGQYDRDRVMQAVYQTQGVEIDGLILTLDEILEQYFIERATWGLRYYEEQFGLPVNEDLDLELRRRLIMAKKRRGRNSLLRILQTVEPSLSLAWGRLIIPFTLVSEEDSYDFGPLITLLEKHKPAHVGYSFRIDPVLPESGYTVYANHYRRNRIRMELLAGTAHAGRWPWWSTSGLIYQEGIAVQSRLIQGKGLYDPSGVLYSGPIRDRENIGVSQATKPTIISHPVIGAADYSRAGTFKVGERPSITTSGQRRNFDIYSDHSVATGYRSPFPCGVYHCGEEVA
ncbi:putative phage tail protein [Paenibacillus popilliae]|uniref:DUF2313 domain-containing protein n=1 Tax=Paenibacillus popilliae ATCC 14706 TaxID=1212764 RepID=M9LYN4_PAEPP|nr:putative phage tail protein [Paenibacillus popilliae]GAC41249.1 hypothetical protein PPOP_0599 [Paenibacillus popilliae ATCC 14706]